MNSNEFSRLKNRVHSELTTYPIYYTDIEAFFGTFLYIHKHSRKELLDVVVNNELVWEHKKKVLYLEIKIRYKDRNTNKIRIGSLKRKLLFTTANEFKSNTIRRKKKDRT